MSMKGARVMREAMRHPLAVGLSIALLALSSDLFACQMRAPSRVQTLGPFTLGPGQRVTVVAHYERAAC